MKFDLIYFHLLNFINLFKFYFNDLKFNLNFKFLFSKFY